MKRYLLAMLTLACFISAPAFAQVNTVGKTDRLVVAQAPGDSTDYSKQPTTTNTQTTTQTPTAPASVTTVVKGGTIAADVLDWFKVILVPIIGALATGIAFKIMQFFGVKVEDSNKAALQAIIVNGLNQAATKAEAGLKGNAALNIDVKNQVIADAVAYTQAHGQETIKALGLDASDPKAVEAIRARIQTAIVDPLTPTNPSLDKIIDKPVAA